MERKKNKMRDNKYIKYYVIGVVIRIIFSYYFINI